MPVSTAGASATAPVRQPRARAAAAAVSSDGAPLPATPRGRRTRQALLDAAEVVFGERGYHSATLVDITQRARVALGTFYLYFPDKKAAFGELVRALNRTLRAEIQSAIAPLSHRLEMEEVGFETFFSFVRRHRNLYRIIRQAEFVDEELYRWHYRTLAEGYVRGLAAAQANGQVRADLDPETLAYALMAIAEGLGMRWVLWEDRLPDATARATISRLLRSGLAAGR